MGVTVKIQASRGDGAFDAYVASPDSAPRAAIIVIQEIFGVNPGIRSKCDALADAGYLAVAPDLFWRTEPGIQLDPDVEAEMARALSFVGPYFASDGPTKTIYDIEDVIHAIRRGILGVDAVAKVGCVGYCLGGFLAYLTACRTDIDASVGYYGVNIDKTLDAARAIARPLMLHIPTADHFVTPDAQAAMHAGLDGNAHVTLHDYPGLDHGFATQTGKRRDTEGADLADSRTAAFFAEHLA